MTISHAQFTKESNLATISSGLRKELPDVNFEDVLVIARQPDDTFVILEPDGEFMNYLVYRTEVGTECPKESSFHKIRHSLEIFFKRYNFYRNEQERYCSDAIKFGEEIIEPEEE